MNERPPLTVEQIDHVFWMTLQGIAIVMLAWGVYGVITNWPAIRAFFLTRLPILTYPRSSRIRSGGWASASWETHRPYRSLRDYVTSPDDDDDDDLVQDDDDFPVQDERNEPAEPGSSSFPGQNTPRTERSALSFTEQEYQAVLALIAYRDHAISRGQQVSKTQAILHAFGAKRGGSAAYVRASEIYDALFGTSLAQSRYPTLSQARQGVSSSLKRDA